MPIRSLAVVLLALAGCTTFQDAPLAQVSSQFFDPAPAGRVSHAPVPAAEDSICVRVDYVGRKLLAANPQIGVKPLFATIQAKDAELFHVDQRVIYITDGLVKQLPSEADLSAALAYELARMVAEREARVKQDIKQIEPRPPIQVPIGNIGQGSMGDMVSTVEMAKYDQKRQRYREATARPDADQLARDYLDRAGCQRADFDRVKPTLTAAARNSLLERQIRGIAPAGNWSP